MKRKIGKFTISNYLLKNIGSHKDLMRLMGRMVIVRAEQIFEIDAVEYIAISDYFEEVKEGEEAPKYQFVFTNNDIKCEAL